LVVPPIVSPRDSLSQALPQAKAEDGWITLFDGKDLEQWDQVGQSNWHLAERHGDCRQDGRQRGRLSRQQEAVQGLRGTRRILAER
jgi:hypothetical protein